jgi:hypothetical protein
MKIEFSPGARLQLDVLSELDSIETGFLFGFNMGRYLIIESFFPLRFTKNSINRIYPQVFNHFSDRLLGVFFINRKAFLNDWFLENIILQVKDHSQKIFLCRFDDQSGQKQWVPISGSEDG